MIAYIIPYNETPSLSDTGQWHSTIYKITLNIADMDRHYYQSHEMTVALHPSETHFRFMVRLIAFMLNASDELSFTKGLSTSDEPDLWQKLLTDEIELWIDLGQPDEKKFAKPVDVLNRLLSTFTMNVKLKSGGSNNSKNYNVLTT